MTSVTEARAAMLAVVTPSPPESVVLDDAAGRVLAAPIIAQRAQPPFAAAAMDGYALRAKDAPEILRIVGESAAGHGFSRALAPGEAVRISTGAPMPEAGDAVLIQEEAQVDGATLRAGAIDSGRHVRAAGCDFAAGATLLDQGRALDPIALALAAAAGAAHVSVAKRPRVSVLCCGDEIAQPGGAPRADQIFESCSYAVTALAQQWGAKVFRASPLPDDAEAITRVAAGELARGDLVIFIGGASVGPRDHAKSAIVAAGANILVHAIEMRPGKPTWFAKAPGALVLGLPGNPASAIVASILFLRPLIDAFLGRMRDAPIEHAKLARDLSATGPRETYLRARVHDDGAGGRIIAPLADQDSSLLSVFARSNALLVRPAGAPSAQAGEPVAFIAI